MRAAYFAVTLFFGACLGCANDRPTLDGFSHAYAGFQDSAGLTNQALLMSVDQGSDYWRALTAAMNTHAPNQLRSAAASTALAAWDAQTAPLMAVFHESIGSMDSSVTVLIESANRIKDANVRAQAAATAGHARALQVAYAALFHVWDRRYELQLEVLRDLVADKGAIGTAIADNLPGVEEQRALGAESDTIVEEVTRQSHQAEDMFSAMKGQFALKTYRSRWKDSVAAVPGR